MTVSPSRRPLRRTVELLDRTPRWVSILLGVGCAALGLALLTRPLTSLTLLGILIGAACVTTGVSDLMAASRSATPRTGRVLGVAWILLGIAIVGWLGHTIGLLAPVVAVALVCSGVTRLVRVLRGDADERAATVLFGSADIVFGAVAWFWPDVTLLVVSLLFGIRTVVFGVTRIWAGVTGRPDRSDAPPVRRPVARFGRTVAATLAFALAIGTAVLGHQMRTGTPTVDAFYTAPASVPAEPGALLRVEPFTRDVPDDAIAWRILYTTTRDEGAPALASGIVMVGRGAPAGPRPVIAWAHGTTGYGRQCAPSLVPAPFESGALPAESALLDRGWALVATDYVGLGTEGSHPYLIGQGEARSVLDAVLAARQLDGVHLSDRTVVWGHSQGGHAALWTGILAPSYAPDAGVVAVAAMAPASDLVGLVGALPGITGGSLFASYVLAAYPAVYPDIDPDSYVRPAARTLLREMSTRCLSEPGVVASALTALSMSGDGPYLRQDPTLGAFGRRLAENIPAGPLSVPLLLAQGETDPLVTPAMQSGFVDAKRREGWEVDYRTYPDRDHIGLVADDSGFIPELLAWTERQF
ncbi:lipase family protein [Rhodococcus sp. NPDC058505]|uniref:lipase family protein n=1 Tax=Rhodococcus sp. NPDC058505 TaxID=3346531 RepID=UPI003650712B